MDFNTVEALRRVLLYFVPFLFALCFHEFAHGFVARMKGDRTAELMGRLTLNPMAHADPIGTFFLPIMAMVFQFPFFGWAKPVPVNERNLRRPKQDMFWIALAGPMSNVLLAIVATLFLVGLERFAHLPPGHAAYDILRVFLVINLFLAVFNLIPAHPLDGGKVLARFLPENANRFLEDNQAFGMYLLIVLMVTGAFKYLAIPVYALAEFFYGWAHVLAGVLGG